MNVVAPATVDRPVACFVAAGQPSPFYDISEVPEPLRGFIVQPSDEDEFDEPDEDMAEVIHRYVGDPAAKRGLARRGLGALRREQTTHEKTKRMRLEMQLAVERGELIRQDLVERQAAFLLTAMRQRCMSAPSAWARRLLNISDPRVMTERLRDMMASVLEEINNLPEQVTNAEWTGDEDGAPLRKVDRGPANNGVGEREKLNRCPRVMTIPPLAAVTP